LFTRHKTPEEYNNGVDEEGNLLKNMSVYMETVRKIFTDLKSYHENF